MDLPAGDLLTFRVAPTQTSYAGGNLIDPMTSAGDLVYRNAGNTTARLPAGTTGQVLTVSAPGIVSWQNNPAGFTDPMTLAGDLIYKNAGGTTTRLGIGSVGQVLGVTGIGTVAWSSPSAAVQTVTMTNETGGPLPAFMPIRSTSGGTMGEIDVSVEAQAIAIVGLTTVAVANNTDGAIVSSGRVYNITGAWNFGDVLYVSKLAGLTNIKPSIGVNGFVAGDFVIKVGVIVRNETVLTNKDLIMMIQVVGEL
jgi:hypothetical protein